MRDKIKQVLSQYLEDWGVFDAVDAGELYPLDIDDEQMNELVDAIMKVKEEE